MVGGVGFFFGFGGTADCSGGSVGGGGVGVALLVIGSRLADLSAGPCGLLLCPLCFLLCLLRLLLLQRGALLVRLSVSPSATSSSSSPCSCPRSLNKSSSSSSFSPSGRLRKGWPALALLMRDMMCPECPTLPARMTAFWSHHGASKSLGSNNWQQRASH